MADHLCGLEIEKAVQEPLKTAEACFLRLMPDGPLGPTLFWFLVLCIAAIPFVFRYYVGLVGQESQPESSLERQFYEKLRASLAGDNPAARLYAQWLTKFLDWIERFCGDVGMADRTLFPRFFWLTKPAPLWTAPALDRCLLIAVIYPVATIFLIWMLFGQVGPAETALGLRADLPVWRRVLGVAAYAASALGIWRYTIATGRRSFVWGSIVFFSPFVGLGALGFDNLGASAVISFFIYQIVYVLAFAFVFAVVAVGSAASKYKSLGFYLFFLSAMTVACVAAAKLAALPYFWQGYGPFLLFLGLLTLLSAPFDWVSLGLTRALLRRGLELEGWWPYLLALLDACLAAIIVALLALVMVLGVQTFDELAVHSGGKTAAVLDLDILFDGLAKDPAAPKNWWAYALLLSSMIPSLVNLAIGGMALTRGIPWLGRLLLQWIPADRAVPLYKQQLAATGLTAQVFAGVLLGVAAQVFLLSGVVFHLMPAIGLDLLAMARAIAEYDLPSRVGTLFAGSG